MKTTILIITILITLISCTTGGLAPEAGCELAIGDKYASNYWTLCKGRHIAYTTNVTFTSDGAIYDINVGGNYYTNLFMENPFTSNYIN